MRNFLRTEGSPLKLDRPGGQGSGGLMRNTILMLGGRLFTIFSNLAYLTLSARLFTVREVAVLALLAAVSALMDVSKGFGLGPVVLKRMPNASGDEQASLISSFLVYSVVPLAAAAMLGLAASEALAATLLDEGRYGGQLAAGIGCAFFICLTNSNLFLLQTRARFGLVTGLQLLTQFLQKLCPCLAIWATGGGFDRFLTVSLAAAAAGWTVSLAPLLGWIWRAGRRWIGLRSVWGECRQYYLASLLRYGATQVDSLMVAFLFDSAALAVYFILRRLYSTGVVLIDSFSDALVPDLARRTESAAWLTLQAWNRRALMAAGLLAAVMVANGQGALGLVFGSRYVADLPLVLLFSMATVTYLQLCHTQIESLLFRNAGANLRITFSTAVMNAMAGLALAPWFGPAGLVGGLLCGHLAGVLAGAEGGRRRLAVLGPTAGVLAGLCAVGALTAQSSTLRLPEWGRTVLLNGALAALGWRLAGVILTEVGDV